MQTAFLTLAFNRVSPASFRRMIEAVRDSHPFFRDNLELKGDYASHDCWIS